MVLVPFEATIKNAASVIFYALSTSAEKLLLLYLFGLLLP
jgi:hypothetical protein